MAIKIPKPRPLKGNNPGLRDSAPHGMAGAGSTPPLAVRAGEAVAGEVGSLAKMGQSMAKSAGHKAHDILHGIGL